MPEADSKFYALSALCVFVFICLTVFPKPTKADESTLKFDTFACPTVELMESFAQNGVLAEHNVCSLLNWNDSVTRAVAQAKLQATYLTKLVGPQPRHAARPTMYAVEVQGKKLYAIKNPGFAEEWKSTVTISLIPDYPYKTWMKTYRAVTV